MARETNTLSTANIGLHKIKYLSFQFLIQKYTNLYQCEKFLIKFCKILHSPKCKWPNTKFDVGSSIRQKGYAKWPKERKLMQRRSIFPVYVSQIIFNRTKTIVEAIANDGYIYFRREVKSFTASDTLEGMYELKSAASKLEILDYPVSAIKCAAKRKQFQPDMFVYQFIPNSRYNRHQMKYKVVSSSMLIINALFS